MRTAASDGVLHLGRVGDSAALWAVLDLTAREDEIGVDAASLLPRIAARVATVEVRSQTRLGWLAAHDIVFVCWVREGFESLFIRLVLSI